MQINLRKQFAKLLRETADKIDRNDCELSEDEVIDLMSVISHHVMSKSSACSYLNLSRSRFDDLVREGIIPKGRKRKGFNELVWYEDELHNVVLKHRNL